MNFCFLSRVPLSGAFSLESCYRLVSQEIPRILRNSNSRQLVHKKRATGLYPERSNRNVQWIRA